MAAMFWRLRGMNSLHNISHRHFSSILNPNPNIALSGIQKTKAALVLMRPETNPERIIELCRAASLTPNLYLDRVAFSLAVAKLTSLNYLVGVRSYLEELKKNRFDLRNECFFSYAITLYGRAGMLLDAIRTFKEMDKLDVPRSNASLSALFRSCMVANNMSELRRIYVEFPKTYGIDPDIYSYNTVIMAFSQSGSSDSVYSVISDMEAAKKVKPNAVSFGYLIAGLYNEGKYDDVVGKVFELMKKYHRVPGFKTFNVSIQSLCYLKKTSEAKALFDLMVEKDMEPDAVTYKRLINGYCNEGNLDKAKELLKSMESEGCELTRACSFVLIFLFCRSKDFDTAWQILKEALSNGWCPKFTKVKSVVYGLVSISKIEEARELVRKVQGRFIKIPEQLEELEAAFPK